MIVAINKAPAAPMVKIASFVLAGDLFDLVPQWIDKLSARGGVKL